MLDLSAIPRNDREIKEELVVIIAALVQRLGGKADLTQSELDANANKNVIIHRNIPAGEYFLELQD